MNKVTLSQMFLSTVPCVVNFLLTFLAFGNIETFTLIGSLFFLLIIPLEEYSKGQSKSEQAAGRKPIYLMWFMGYCTD